MTFTRYCEDARQPCPNPHQCQVDCHFNCATLSAKSHDLPIVMLDDPVDLDWIRLVGRVCGALMAAVIFGGLAGYIYGSLK